MKTKKVAFVNRSDVFDRCKSAWLLFRESDPGVSWGDQENQYTLVSPKMIVDVLTDELENLSDSIEENIDDDGKTEHSDIQANDQTREQVETVIERLESLSEGVFVDLEN